MIINTGDFEIKLIKKFSIDDKDYYKQGDTLILSNSMMRDYDTCPNLFRDLYITKTLTKELDSDSITIGKAVDCILTEGRDVFDKKYQACNKKDWDEVREQITPAVYEKVEKCVKSITRQNIWKKVFEGRGSKQEPIGIEIEITDLIRNKNYKTIVKGKLDHLDIENKIVMDLKTSKDFWDLEKKIKGEYEGYDYYAQVSWYILLSSLITNIDFDEWDGYIAGVETTGKFNSQFYSFKRAILKIKVNETLRTLIAILESIELNDWSHEENFGRCFNYEDCESNQQLKFIEI